MMRLYNNRKSPFSWIETMITLVIITSFLSELSLVEIAKNVLPLLIIGLLEGRAMLFTVSSLVRNGSQKPPLLSH
ncbi:UNVERIFIED_CONTAM: hypothetical protein KB569_03335 [Streptococcus canis]